MSAPVWVELSSPDADASAAFYEALFGWSATAPGPQEETGGYRTFEQEGASVAGLMGHAQPGQPVVWSTYFSTEDADATAARVAEAGGTTVVEPMDVTDIGRMAFFADPSDAVFGVWQARGFAGFELRDEPVSVFWNELQTRDVDGSLAFYAAVFGWDAEGTPATEGPYTVWLHEGRPVAGMTAIEAALPDMPPHWSVCFAVGDADAIAARAGELGGQVHVAPRDITVGRLAVLSDPQGAAFAVLAAGPQQGAAPHQ